MRSTRIWVTSAAILAFPSIVLSQRINDDLVVLYDFTEGDGNIVHDRGPSLGVPGDPIDLTFDPNELSSDPIAGQFGDRPGLISWGDSWLNINKDHPVDNGTPHGTPDAAVIWDGGPGESSKLVDMIAETGQFTLEAWVRPASIDNRSNTGRIVWMTVEGTDDASNFVLGQQSCCDGGGQPGGIQIRLNTDDPATRVILDSDGFLFDEDDLIHIVHTHDTASEETQVYLNIEGTDFDADPVIDDFVLGQDLFGWDPDYTLAVGNDPYRFSRWFGGELHLIAMYSRAFSVSEIQQQFEAGPGVSASLPGDYNGDGVLNAMDIDLQAAEMKKDEADWDLAKFDHNNDGVINLGNSLFPGDRMIWVTDLFGTSFGDANLNGVFNADDLITVFQAQKYNIGAMASWAEGDFTGDMLFNADDLVLAFQRGGYVKPGGALAAVPEPSGLVLISLLGLMGFCRRGGASR